MEDPKRAVTDSQASDAWRGVLLGMIAGHEQRLTTTKNRWNHWYYTSMYGGILFSALAALVLKLETGFLSGAEKADLAALFAMLAALLGTASAAGNFQRRWRAARLARAEMQKLLIDLQHPNADLNRVSEECKRVIDAYQQGAIGQ